MATKPLSPTRQLHIPRKTVIKWLLDSDPAIRWQVMRDLNHEPPETVSAERSRVGVEGWGAKLLSEQDERGHWGGDADLNYWMRTTYTLALLKDLGLDPKGEPARQCMCRVCENITWKPLAGRRFFDGETEPCINGGILAVGSYFGQNCDKLVELLLGEQLEDGGWNCEAPKSSRSSFHTTICVLEGLWQYEKAHQSRAVPKATAARLRGEEYLLKRGLFRRLSTGEVIEPKWARFAFPTTWHYDVLRGLDYLRDTGFKADERLTEAVLIVEKRAHQNSRWPLNVQHKDRVPFEMESGVGRASRWNTLRALRVLAWAKK